MTIFIIIMTFYSICAKIDSHVMIRQPLIHERISA